MKGKQTYEVVLGMLREPVPHGLMDSGAIYGYNHDENSKKDIENSPDFRIVDYDGKPQAVQSLYAFLTEHLVYDHDMTCKLYRFALSEQMERKPWLQCMEVFCSERHNPEAEYGFGAANTCNFPNTLDQDIQYDTFEDDDGRRYVVVQVHGGCDLMRGYTEPKVFTLQQDIERFWMGMTDIHCRCKCTTIEGEVENQWYDDHGNDITWPKHWGIGDNVVCSACNGTVHIF